MTYTGNQLTGLREGSGPVLPYTYDANGNMTSDGRKNLQITYNVLNLQQSLSQNGTTVASYTWLSDSTKCGVVDNNSIGYDYLGSLIYSRSGSTRTLENIETGAGRKVYTGDFYTVTGYPETFYEANAYYYTTDHLGSTRAIINSSGTVVERNDYYPFGGQHGNSSYPQLAGNRFKYNGKEVQTTGNIGYLDYGARMYDDVDW
jgi:YD repeat-containing protein